jgi:hypothetical protein
MHQLIIYTICCFFCFLYFVNNKCFAEEYLVKGRAKYLGWQIEIGKFQTCGKTIIEIENGYIKETEDECPKDMRTSPMIIDGKTYPRNFIKIRGYLKEKDDYKKIFVLEDAYGKKFSVFIFKYEIYKDYELNTKLAIECPVEGRGDKVYKISFTPLITDDLYYIYRLLKEVHDTIEAINQKSARIAQLNRDIMEAKANGQTANNLLIQRDLEIRRLSKIIGVRTYATSEGTLNVTLLNGFPIVQGIVSLTLTYRESFLGTGNFIWQGPGNITKIINTNIITDGELSDLLQRLNKQITKYLEK